MKVAIVGSGSWGTALALHLARNEHEVTLLGRDADELMDLTSTRQNHRYLPGYELPENVGFGEVGEPVSGADFWIIAVPSPAVRECTKLIPCENPFLVLASKGLEPGTAKLLSDVAQEEKPNAMVGAVSGPNLAVEIAQGIPTAAVTACADEVAANRVCVALQSRKFRAYYSSDVVGVELSGALKNVLAIGAGMSDGLGYGDNTKGALLARGLGEMVRLGLAMGARTETFFGIAGVGDLFATANSRLSRNYRVGLGLGQGRALKEVLLELGQVAEGVGTAECVTILSEKYDIELPIMKLVHAVINGQLTARDGVGRLMEREPKREEVG